jgi:ribosomal protein S18 acetylase RimI-like enzyme
LIRPYREGDLAALYDICVRTGDAGGDASGLVGDPDLYGHVYAGPYAAFAPELAFVVEDDDGVGGYVLGALDTVAFADRCEREWWPPLRDRYPEGSGARKLDELLIALIHHPPRRDPAVLAEFPSHLHIDLLPRLQGQGWGRRLLSSLEDALRAQGSTGLHFGVGATNSNALGFYRRLGYDEHGTDGYSIVFTRRL